MAEASDAEDWRQIRLFEISQFMDSFAVIIKGNNRKPFFYCGTAIRVFIEQVNKGANWQQYKGTKDMLQEVLDLIKIACNKDWNETLTYYQSQCKNG